MKNLTICFLFLSIVFSSCKQKADKNANADSEKAQTILACTGEGVETPRGEVIYKHTDKNGDVYITLFSLEQDSAYMFQNVPSKDNAGQYLMVDVTAFAYKDINPSTKEGVYTSEYDLDGTDGKKMHQTAFFIKSKEDVRNFKQRTYTCFNSDTHTETADLSGANISCSSIDVAKSLVERILSKLPK